MREVLNRSKGMIVDHLKRRIQNEPITAIVVVEGDQTKEIIAYRPSIDDQPEYVLEQRLKPYADKRHNLLYSIEPNVESEAFLRKFDNIYHILPHPLLFRRDSIKPSTQIYSTDEEKAIIEDTYWGSKDEQDERYMKEAIMQAQVQSGDAKPKVGAIIVKNDSIIARANRTVIKRSRYSTRTLHAERYAILQAQENREDLTGATLYSTLEPCLGLGNNIESCSDLTCSSGISRVVFGVQDNFNFQGRAVEYLRNNQIACQKISSPELEEVLMKLKGKHNYLPKGVFA
ncbi:hypothetical protein KW805_01010 [Candidatus Pacearchaeota archaeon]|nr:hypothetical protein [Candidatus Pacearchaeota archaeon]